MLSGACVCSSEVQGGAEKDEVAGVLGPGDRLAREEDAVPGDKGEIGRDAPVDEEVRFCAEIGRAHV